MLQVDKSICQIPLSLNHEVSEMAFCIPPTIAPTWGMAIGPIGISFCH
jgi:hypothetical protein